MRPLRDRLRDSLAAGNEPARLEGLVRLEQRLLGEPGHGLPLRQRLERLVAWTARDRGPARRSPWDGPLARPEPALPAASLEELLPRGRIEENEKGRFLLVHEELALDRCHGEVSLSRFRALDRRTLAILDGDAEAAAYEAFEAERAVLLDTETTGLAGGAGTAAFLVGAAFVRGEALVVRQYLMRDYDEEPAMLHALAQDLRAATHLVTFNGRGFDVPLLEARYRINRLPAPLAPLVHLDLLPPARRLWGERFESCRLQALECELLGLRRTDDVPGEEIPRLYFEYLRDRNGRGLAPVLEHNRLDVVSLAALLAFSCRWVEERPAQDAREHYGLARVFERAAVHERCDEHYRHVVRQGEGPLRLVSLRRLAARAKRAGDHASALPLWCEAAEAGEWWALRELAIHHEHRGRDLHAALDAVEDALRLGAGRLSGRAHAELQHRRARVLRKMERTRLHRPSRRPD